MPEPNRLDYATPQKVDAFSLRRWLRRAYTAIGVCFFILALLAWTEYSPFGFLNHAEVFVVLFGAPVFLVLGTVFLAIGNPDGVR